MSLSTTSMYGRCLGCLLQRSLLQVSSTPYRAPYSTDTQARLKRKTQTYMKSWNIHQYEGIDGLVMSTSVKIPKIIHPQDILVQVHAASVNPIDVLMIGGYGRVIINNMRKGLNPSEVGPEFPLTVGRDFSGVVMATGPKVTKFKPGDEVWGALGAQRHGTHTQYTVTGEKEISKKPTSLSHVEAASIPYVAMTTWAALCTFGNLTEKNAQNKRVLIFGGSGGLGTFAIQLVKAWGGHVISVCSEDAIPLLTTLGVDTVLDRTGNIQQQLVGLDKIYFVLDPINTLSQKDLPIFKSLKGGTYVSLKYPLLEATDKFGAFGLLTTAPFLAYKIIGLLDFVNYKWAFFLPNGKALGKIADLVDNGQIRPVIDKVFPFDEVPAAFEKVHAGHARGKTVIDMMS